MGNSNNYIKDLGITPTKQINSKDFAAMWQNYDKNKKQINY